MNYKIIKKNVFLLFLFLSVYSYTQIIPENRRINWNPGIETGIPEYPIFANIKNAPYNATGDGVTDDAVAIQSAIDACPDGQAIFLPEGEYYLGTSLKIFRQSVVIRGAGPDKTRLKGNIEIYAWGSSDNAEIISGFEKNSEIITVDNASNFNVGDYIIVDQENDPSFVTKTGYIASGCNWCSRENGNRAMGQIVEITGKTGNDLNISKPLYFTFSSLLNPQIIKISSPPVSFAGIEDLYIEPTTSDYNISIRLAVHCWVKNVVSYNAKKAHVQFLTTYGCVIRDSYFHHGQSYTSGNAYGLIGMKQCTDNLIENNTYYYLRHSMVLEGGGCGNVFGYNYSSRMFDDNYPDTDWLGNDMITHGAHPYMNLFEGNIVTKISCDNTWGSSSHNTFLRNHVVRQSEGENEEIIYSLLAVSLDENNRYQNFLGNVFGTEACEGSVEEIPYISNTSKVIWKLGYYTPSGTGMPTDTLVKATLLRHGNYNYISDAVTWDDTIATHVLPNSLYLNEKPDFFKNMDWPSIGSDIVGYVDSLPAKLRFEELMDTSSVPFNTTSSFSVNACTSYTVPSGDETYTSSGIYMDTINNNAGYDSIMTIDLNIIELNISVTDNSPTLVSNAINASYQWLDCNNNYAPISAETSQSFLTTSNGDYAVEITNNGCVDTSACISISVNTTSTSSFSVNACTSYTVPSGNETYTSSGVYMDTINNSLGYDSIMTIDVSINHVNTIITNNSPILISNEYDASYKWLDCNNNYLPINGETSQSFLATSNGGYAVEITNNGCIDTSECVTISGLGFEEKSLFKDVSIYPNPTNDNINVMLNAQADNTISLELYDLIGKKVTGLKQQVSKGRNLISLSTDNLSDGIYMLKISVDSNVSYGKVSIKR